MDQPKNCPQCGKPLPANAPGGLCPECLLKAGVATGTQGAARSKPRRRHFEAPAVAELAPLFPQLEILQFIGQGGMGAVYQARQTALGRVVALKIIPSQTGDEPGFAARFAREARALAQLSHPNIVSIHDFGERGGYHFFVMEYVDGLNLRQLLNSGGIGPKEALAVVPQICDALQYAHDRGVVHRDIKPENILMDKSGTVKIADFGLAKLVGGEPEDQTITGGADVIGTPHYMAPEQVERPLEVDHRADIYSLGVVFYQMLTGELPIGRFANPSKKVQIDVRLDEIVLRALEKEPGLRFQQAGALKTEVLTVSQGGPSKESRSIPPAGGMFRRRLLQMVGGLAAVAAVLFIARTLALRKLREEDAVRAQFFVEQPETATPANSPGSVAATAPAASPGPPVPPAEAAPAPRPRVIPPVPAPVPAQNIFVQPAAVRPEIPTAPAYVPPASAISLPQEFDAMESDPEILRLQLRQAQSELSRAQELFKIGLITQIMMLSAQNRVGQIQARLDGDRVGFAQIEVAAAQRQYDEAAIRRQAGLMTAKALGEAEMNLEISKIRLRAAEAKAK